MVVRLPCCIFILHASSSGAGKMFPDSRHDRQFSIARNNRNVWNLAGQNRESVTLRRHRSFFRMLRATMAMRGSPM